MNSLAKGLGWLGLALILAPLALFCALLAVFVAPNAAIILGFVLGTVAVRKLLERRRNG